MAGFAELLVADSEFVVSADPDTSKWVELQPLNNARLPTIMNFTSNFKIQNSLSFAMAISYLLVDPTECPFFS